MSLSSNVSLSLLQCVYSIPGKVQKIFICSLSFEADSFKKANKTQSEIMFLSCV